MGQNITIMGANYTGVEQTAWPKTGGGTATFVDPSGTTAVPSDVASGKYFLTAAGVLTQGTASGGGGASNAVTGTFKGTTTGAMDINLSYSGSGYPVALVIYPDEGAYNPNGTFYGTTNRYAYTTIFAVRNVPALDGYSGSQNLATYRYYYKSSSSTANSVSSGGSNSSKTIFDNSDATSSNPFKIRSKTKMSVYIALSSYGFAANVEYKYWVLYSS